MRNDDVVFLADDDDEQVILDAYAGNMAPTKERVTVDRAWLGHNVGQHAASGNGAPYGTSSASASGNIPEAQIERTTPTSIDNLVMFESGMWAVVGGTPQIVRRSYRTHVDGDVYDRIAKTIDPKAGFSRDNISNISGAVINQEIDTTVLASIPGGYNERRIIFMMMFSKINQINQSKTLYYINGYTDKVDMSYNGHLAPDTQFYINEIVEIYTGYRRDKLGNKIPFQRLESCDQLVTGYFNPRDFLAADYSIRPVDLFQSMRENDMLRRHNINGDYSLSDSFVFNSANKYKRSSRINNNPTDYIGRSLRALNDAQGDKDVGTEAELYENAVYRLKEDSVTHDSLLGSIGRRCDIRRNGFVDYRDLLSMFPEMNDPERFRNATVPNQTQTQLDSVDLTSRAYEVSIGSSLVSAISSVAMKHYLTTLHFVCTPVPTRQTYGLKTDPYEISPLEVKGYLPYQHVMTKFEDFKREMLECVLPSIIADPDNVVVEFEVFFNIIDKTYINISVNGGEWFPQTYASFCDGIAPPVIANGHDTLASISNDVTWVYDNFYGYDRFN